MAKVEPWHQFAGLASVRQDTQPRCGARAAGVLQSRQDEISLERNIESLDSIVEVMIEGVAETGSRGRTVANQVVHLAPAATLLAPGDVVRVRIDHAGKHSLKGTLAD